MTKAQLVAKLAEAGGVSRKQADDFLTALIDNVVKTVKKGEALKIPGLGIFRLRKMKARIGRNPQTGEPIKIPARKKVGFTVAKAFKEAVLGKKSGPLRVKVITAWPVQPTAIDGNKTSSPATATCP